MFCRLETYLPVDVFWSCNSFIKSNVLALSNYFKGVSDLNLPLTSVDNWLRISFYSHGFFMKIVALFTCKLLSCWWHILCLHLGGKEGVLVVWQLDTGRKKFLPRIGSPLLWLTDSPDPSLSSVNGIYFPENLILI